MKVEVDFRTPLQKERDDRDKKIYSRYREIRTANTQASEWAVWRVIANEFDMTNPHRIGYAIKREENRQEVKKRNRNR